MRGIILFLLIALFSLHASAQTDTAFWISIPTATKGHATTASTDTKMYIRVTALDVAAKVTVSIPAAGITLPAVNVAANTVASIDITSYRNLLECWYQNNTGGVLTGVNNGLKVTSTANITAYYDEASTYDPEIWALKGRNALGLKFYVPGQDIWGNGTFSTTDPATQNYSPTPYNTISFVATQDNTTVTFKPSNDCLGGYLKGNTYTVVLNKGQTFCIVAASTIASAHLGGTVIQSDKPIAVTMSDDSVGAYDSKKNACFDMGGDQLVPTNMYGLEYISAVGTLDYQTTYTPNTYDVAVVTALVDNTTIDFYQTGNTIASVTINAGKVYELPYKTNPVYIKASAPISLMHITGNGCELGYAQVPPISCTGSLEVGVVRANTQRYSIVVLVDQSGINGFTAKVNGTTVPNLIPASAFTAIPGTTWEYAKIDNIPTTTVPAGGSVLVTNTVKFHMGTINGDGTTGCSYGYFSDFAGYVPKLSSSAPVCSGKPFQLFCDPINVAAGQTFIWTGNGFLSTEQNPMPNPATAGVLTYYCQVTQPGCSYPLQQIDVTVNPTPDVTVPADETFCNGVTTGDFVFTSSVANTSFAWVEKNPSPGVGMPSSSGTGKLPSFKTVNNSNTQISDVISVTPSTATCTGSPGSFTITVNPTPVITVQPATNVKACVNTTAVFSVTSNTADVAYQWQTNSGTSTYKDIVGATSSTLTLNNVTLAQNGYRYRVVITSTTSSCPSTTSNYGVLTVNPQPYVQTNPPAAPCYPGTVNLKLTNVIKGSAGNLVFTYFTDAAGTIPIPDPTKVGAGTYYIVGTDQYTGCPSAPIPVTVTVNPLPKVVTNPVSYCKNGDADLTDPAVTAGSDPNLKFAYYTDAQAQHVLTKPTSVKAGTYYIVATSTATSCVSNPVPVTVTENPLPVAVTHPQSVCAPNVIDLTKPAVTSDSDPNLTFSYFLDYIQQYPIADPTQVSSGTYYIVGTNTVTHCSSVPVAVTAKVIALPNVVTNDVEVCYPSTASLTAASVTAGSDANLTYTYFTDANATIALTTPSSVGTGTYYIVGTSSSTGCSANPKSVTVTVNPKPSVTTNPQTVCAPAKVDLTSTNVTTGSDAGLQFSYFTDAAGTSPVSTSTAVGSGTYYISGRNPITTCVSDIVPVTVTVIPQPHVATTPQSVCTPNYVDLTVPGATAGSDANLRFIYYVDAQATTTVGLPNSVSSGTYYIVGKDLNTGCSSVPVPIVAKVNDLPKVVANNKTVCAPTPANLTDASVTAGSEANLSFTYFTNAAATIPVTDATNVPTGIYYIVGKSTVTGCVADPVAVSVQVNQQPNVVTNPQSACYPATVNLKNAAVVNGSDAGLSYTYYTDALATQPIPDATTVGAGTYYIVGKIPSTGCTSNPIPVNVTINYPPNVVITDPAAVCAPQTVDITAPAITAGSASDVTYTYFSDAAGKKPLTVAQASQISQSGMYYIVGTSNSTGCSTSPLPVNVTIKAQPPVNPIQGDQQLCAGSSVYLTNQTPSGTWSSNSAVATIDASTGLLTGVSAGTADVIYSITGSNGCVGTSPVFHVTVNPTPNLVITNPDAVCSPGRVDLTLPAVTASSDAGLALGYYLNSAVTSVLTNPNSVDAGTYYIKATNTTTGCVTIKPVVVTVNDKPKVAVTNPAAVCYPDKVNLETALVAAGSDPGLAYKYYTDIAATTEMTTPTQADAGDYYVVGINTTTGCTSDPKKITATINPLPNVVVTNAASCSPNKVDLTAAYVTAGSDGGLTYTYFTDATATMPVADPHNVDPGTYYIVGTSSLGCSAAPQAVKAKINPLPTVVVTNPDPVCSPSGVNLTALEVTNGSTAGLTYTYYTDAAASNVISATAAQNVPGGTYYIVGKDPATGCSSSPVKVVATVRAKPKVQVTNPPAVCSPATINLNDAIVAAGSDPGLTYKFYTDAGGTNIVTDPTQVDAGTYYVIGTNTSTSCSSDPMAITAIVNNQPDMKITNPQGVCTPAKVDLTQPAITAGSEAGLSYTYFTDAAGTIPVANPHSVTAGTYYIVGKAATGCPTSPRAVVATVYDLPNVVTNDPVPVCSPDRVDITAPGITTGSELGLNFTYFTDVNATSPETTPSNVGTGTYYIVGTNPITGCAAAPQPVHVVVNVKPQVQVNNPAAVCAPGKVNLNTAIVAAGTDPGLSYGYYIDAGGTKPVTDYTQADAGVYYIIGTNPGTHCVSNPMKVVATINAQPNVVVTNPDAACAPGKVDLTQPSVTALSDAGLTYTYYTDAGAANAVADAHNVDAGTYYIVGTNPGTHCASNPVPVVAKINPQPVVKITQPDAVCAPNKINLTAAAITAGSSSNLSFLYYTDANASAILSDPANASNGTYYIVGVDNSTGCKSVPMQVNAVVNAQPVVQVNSSMVVCAPAKVNLQNAIVAAGTDPGLTYGYYIDAMGTSAVTDPTKVDAGTYYIIGTNTATSCRSEAMKVVATINPQPSVLVHNPDAACAPNKVDLTAASVTAGSAAGLTYTYFTDANATNAVADAHNVDAGNYYIVGTAGSSTGCSSDPQMVVATINQPPMLKVANPAAVCSPAKIDLTAPAITAGSDAGLKYDYFLNSALTSQVADPHNADNGTYYIKATNTATGCVTVLPVVATVNAQPNVQVTTLPAACAPNKVNLQDAIVAAGTDAGLTFGYYTDATGATPVLTPTQVDAGTYYIIGTNPATNCQSVAKQVVVSINAEPVVKITNPDAVCAPGKVDLTQLSITAGSDAGLTYTYFTDASATNAVADAHNVDAGTYYIVGTASTGCPSSPKAVTATINAKPTVVVVPPAAVCSPNTIDLTAAAITAGSTPGLAYTYFTNSSATSSLANPSQVSNGGTYYIVGRDISTNCLSNVQPVTVTIHAKPSIQVAPPPTVCAPAKGDLTQVVTTGSDPNLTFEYYTDASGTTAVTTPSQVDAGTYYVIGKDNTTQCASDAKAVVVTINAAPKLVITNPDAVCAPNKVDLTQPAVTAGSDAGLLYTYYTDANATTPVADAHNVDAGTYYIVAKASSGCLSAPKPVVATINAQPVVVIHQPDAVCAPNTVNLTAPAITAGSDPNTSFKYYLDAAASQVLANPSQVSNSGTYYIVATNNATTCATSGTYPVTVTVHAKPHVQVAPPPTVCAPAKADLTQASTTGSDPGLTFKFYTDAGGTNEVTTPTQVDAGTYYIIGTNTTTGCVSSPVSFTVTIHAQPVLAITNPNAVCAPSKVDLTQPSITAGSESGLIFTYYTDAQAATPLAAGDETHVDAGTYYIKGTAANGCATVVKPVVAQINQQPLLVVAQPAAVCSPNTIDLTAASITAGSETGLTFKYYTDASLSSQLANPQQAIGGTYYIVATKTATQCVSVAQAVTVTIHAQPNIQVGNPPAVCAPNKVDLTQSPKTGSDPGLTYTYYTDAIAASPVTDPTQAGAGTYYVVGRNTATGCVSAVKSITATVHTQPKLVITNPPAVCAPGKVDLTQASITANSDAGLSFTYFESDKVTPVADPHNVDAGTYYITATDGINGCPSVQAAVVAQVMPQPLLVTHDPAALCAPATADLTVPAVTSGSTPNLTFTYYAADGVTLVPDATHAGKGDYYIVGTNAAGCASVPQKVTVTVNDLPQVKIANPAAVCYPATVNLKDPAITAGSTAGLTFTYYTDQNLTSPVTDPTKVGAGDYYIVGTSSGASGCNAAAQKLTVVVNAQPLVAVHNPAPVCAPGTANLKAPAVTAGSEAGLTYTYYVDASSATQVPDATQVGAGTYYITGTNTTTGCTSDRKMVTVIVNPPPTFVVHDPAEVCAPAKVDLTATAVTAGSDANLNFTYYTDAGMSAEVVDPTKVNTGTYYITAENANGCVAGPLAVNVKVNGIPQVKIANPVAVCFPATVNLQDPAITAGSDANLTYTYYTDINLTNPVPDATKVGAGDYYVVGKSTANCISAAQKVTVTVNPKPSVVLHAPAAVCAPGTVNLTAPAVTSGSDADLSFHYYVDATSGTTVPDPAQVGAGTYYISGTSNTTGCESDRQAITVKINAQPNVQVNPPAAVCAPAKVNLSAPAVTNGSDANLTYAYYSDAALNTPVNNPAQVGSGTYYIVGTNGNGCKSAAVSVTVTVNSIPLVKTNAPAAVCAPGTVDLTAAAVTNGSDAGLTFTYYADQAKTSPISASDAAQIGVSGVYYIVGTNGSTTCVSNATPVTVTINDKPKVATVNPAAVCDPATVDLTAPGITSGSDAGLSFSYYTAATGNTLVSTPSSVGAGTYYIEGKNLSTGCVSSRVAVTVTVNSQPNVVIVNPAAICAPGKINLKAPGITAGSDANLQFTYFTDANATSPLADPAHVGTTGTYYIVGTNASGCSSNPKPVNVTITNKPAVLITNPVAVCDPATVNLQDPAITSGSSAGLSYGYFIDKNATTPVNNPAQVAVSGTYYIVGTSGSAPFCSSDAMPVVVTINKKPVVVTHNPTAVCYPGTANLEDAAVTNGSDIGLTYTYYTDASSATQVADPTQAGAGDYYIVGTNSNGCSSPRMKVTVTVTPKPKVVIHDPAAICAPGTVNLAAPAIVNGSDPNLTYAYYASDASTILTNTQVGDGTYYIVGTTAAGCSSDPMKVTVTVNSRPQVNITDPAAVCFPGTVNLTDAAVTAGSSADLNFTYYADINGTTVLTNAASVSVSGTYYIRGTGNTTSCQSDIMPVHVTINAKPKVKVTNPDAVCYGSTVNLTDAAITAGSDANLGFTYFTDASATTAVANATQVGAGTYYIVGTASTQCSSDPMPVTVTVKTKPNLVVADPAAICAPGKINLTAASVTNGSDANLSFRYYAADGVTLLTTPSAVDAGDYYIEGVTAAGCVTDKKKVTVTISALPQVVVVDPAPVCAPGKVDLTAASVTAGSDPGLTFIYYAADGTTTINYAAQAPAGTYYIRGKSSSTGCISDAHQVTAVVNDQPKVVTHNPLAVCAPATVDLTTAAVTMGSDNGLNYTYYTDANAATTVADPYHVGAGDYYITGTNSNGCTSNRVKVTVTVNSQPVIALTNPAAVCAPAKVNLTASSITAGNDPSLSYLYYEADGVTAVSDPTQVSAGTYYLVGKAPTGCLSDPQAVQAVVHAMPQVVVNPPATVCTPGTVDLTATAVTAGSDAGLNFLYYTSDGVTQLSNPNSVGAGTYYIAGKSADGCYSEKQEVTVKVTARPNLLVASPAAVCAPLTVDLTAQSVTAGSDPGLNFSYYTDNTATTAVADPKAVGSGNYYIVGATSGGCKSDIKMVTVTVHAKPAISATDPAAVCAPGKVNLKSVVITASDPSLSYTYYQADGATLVTDPTKVDAGKYYIVGTSLDGCSSDAAAVNVTINPVPQIKVTSPDPVCAPGTVDLTAAAVTAGSDAGLSFLYYASDGVTAISSSNAAQISASGTYHIAGKASTGCVSEQKAVTVTINKTPNLVIVNPSAVCAPGTVNLTAAAITAGSDAGLDLAYYTDNAGTQAVPDATQVGSGTYYIRGKAATGCYSDLKAVTVVVTPRPNVVVVDPAPVCEPSLVNLKAASVTAGSDANLSFSYFTDAAATTLVQDPAKVNTGTYYIVGTTPAGCASLVREVHAKVNAKPVVKVGTVGAVCTPNTVNIADPALVAGSDNNLTYKYYTSDGITEVSTPSNAGAGTYYIVGIASTGCKSDPQKLVVTVNPKPYVQVTNPAAVCAPATVNLQDIAITAGSDNYLTYSYYTDLTLQTKVADPSQAGAGVYYIVGTAATGCSSDAQKVTVTVNSQPALLVANPAAVCAPALVNLKAASVTAGSDPNLQLAYYTDNTLTTKVPDPTKVGSGTYYIQGTNTSTTCVSAAKPVVATVNPQPVVKVAAIAPVCAPDKGDLTAAAVTAGSDPNLNFKYYAADGVTELTTPSAVDAGTYYIVGIASTGCKSDPQKLVMVVNSKPVVQLQATATACAPNTVNLKDPSLIAGGTGNLSYQYYQADGTTPVADATKVGAGTYYVVGESAAGCYADAKKIVVKINPQPSLSVTNPPAVCAPATVNLSSAIVGGPAAGVTYTYYAADGTTQVPNPAQVSAGTYYIVAAYATGCSSDKKAVTVTVGAQPTVQPIKGQSPIWVNNTVTFTDATPGGVWSVISADKSIISIDASGLVSANKVGGPATVQYQVTQNGCSNAATYNVTVIEPAIDPITGAGQVCVNATTQLKNQTPGGTWSSADPTIATVNKSGLVTGVKSGQTYIYYSMTNPNGSVRYLVTVNPLPDFTSSEKYAICTGSKAFAQALTPTIPGSTFTWKRIDASGVTSNPAATTGSGTPTDVLTNSTLKPVDVQYNFSLQAPQPTACRNDNVKVIITVTPKAVVTASSNQPVCEGSPIVLTGTSNIDGLNYAWTNASGKVVSNDKVYTIAKAAMSDAQKYTFTVSTVGGTCSNQASVNVTVNKGPVAAVSGPQELCEEGKLQLVGTSNTEVSFQWITPDKKTVPGSTYTVPSATPANSGEYSLIVTNTTGNTCADTIKYKVVVNPAPIIDVTDKGPFCQSKTVDLLATTRLTIGTTEFEWRTPDALTLVAKGPELKLSDLQGDSIRYYAHAINSNGCAVWKRVSLPIGRVPKVEFPAISDMCQYASPFKLVASETTGLPGTGVFSGPGVTGSGMFDPSISAGTYKITYTYTVQSGCADSKEVTFKVYPVPTVDAGQDQSMFEGMSAQLKATVMGGYTSLLWTPAEDSASAHSLSPVVHPKVTTQYMLRATNMYGCFALDSVNVTVMKFEIPNAFSPNGDGVNDKWVIPGLAGYPNSLLEIFNRWGVLLYKDRGNKPWDGKYNGEPVPAGTYYYLIYLNDGFLKKPLSGWLEIVR